MKILIACFVILFCAHFVCAQECILTVNLGDFKLGKTITLQGENFKQMLDVDTERTATFKVPVVRAGYYNLSISISNNEIYLEPGSTLQMVAVPDKNGHYNLQQLDFEYTGSVAKINSFLNNHTFQRMEDIDFLLPEKEYIQKIEKLVAANLKDIKHARLGKEFSKRESFRTRYKTLEPLTRYPIQHYWKNGNEAYVLYDHEDTPVVKEYMVKQFIDTPEAWLEPAYQKYVNNAIGVLNFSFGDDKEVTLKKRIDVMSRYFTTCAICEDIVQSLVLIYIENAQADSLYELQKLYDRYVKNEEYHNEVKEALATQQRLKKGSSLVSATEPYLDMKGNPVSLNDLKGKYIYIDVWATWCGPCRGELPHLKKLEEAMYGKNIYFVSISLDARKKDWMKMVKKEKLGGVQLYGGPDAPIAVDYKIMGIPRFILLDPDGKLINSDMTRPSDPQTLKTLNALKGI